MATPARTTSQTALVTPAQLLAPLIPAMNRLEEFLEKQCEIFETGIDYCVNYVTTNQGKRLRPALAIFSSNAQDGADVGTADDELIKLCAIVELVHIATLVHDDIMDEAEIRRNRLTASAKWGHEISVLLGDCLFAHALTLAAGYPTTYVCKRVSEATNLVCSGEILQTQRRFDLKLKEADYLKMIEMKTGTLFGVSCELGAFLTGASEDQLHKYYEYGRLLGLAYQIYDDCLDLVGTEKEIGKSLGTDLRKGKLTLPLILLLKSANPNEAQLLGSILLNEHANSQGMLRDFIKRYDTLNKSSLQAQGILDQALDQLKDLPSNGGKKHLEYVAAYLKSELQKVA